MRATWGRWLARSLVAGLIVWGGMPALAAPPPAEHFVRPEALDNLVLSPSGKRLAMIITLPGGNRAAAVLDLPPRGEPRVVAGFGDGDVTRVLWVNDDRLAVEAQQNGAWVQRDGGGVLAVDHDGGNPRPLIAWRDGNWSTGSRLPTTRTLPYGWYLAWGFDDGSADVLVYERVVDGQGDVVDYRLRRLNTLNGQTEAIGRGMPFGAHRWLLDSRGELRVVQQVHNGRQKLMLREGSSENWVTLNDVDAKTNLALVPLHLESDSQLIVSAHAGADTLALYAFDLKARKLDPEPLVRLDRFDAYQADYDSKTRQLVGVHVVTDRPQIVWFDAKLAGIQKAVDAALPAGRFNRVFCSRCETVPFLVVLSQSDRQPGEYFIYNRETRALTRIGARRPWIDEATQGRRSFHWIQARDGLRLPLVVTHPAGADDKKALPAVLLVHGGPWVRGADRRWDDEAQFLASRGYRVIEPDFRGSFGYGFAHFRAGWKQWGLAMQDDLADAVAWAAEQGLIDRGRVCIYGGSYGGYAALMGPIRHPGVYRCAASFAGVTDIRLMYNSSHGDISWQSRRFSMPELVGDPEKDAAQLSATSPIDRVAEIKVPVLLAQGTLDRRVPREHANKFESAARAAGVAIERVDYGDEGHGWWTARNHADFLERLERFLGRAMK